MARGAKPSSQRLFAMRDALGHRGPDGSRVEIIRNVGLVHTRLAIVDISEHASQPMSHPNGRWWLSFNGEIFNHQLIRSELRDENFGSAGDTATLLHALSRWGPMVLPRLNGQFAFAALDLDGQRLLLARDRFGIKPLYVAREQGGLWFASEPEALFAAGVEAMPRSDSWRDLADLSCYRGKATLLSGIERLPAGSWAAISLDTCDATVQEWSSPASHVRPDRDRQLTRCPRRVLVSKLEEALRQAVRGALLGDVPIGTMCSGGVDSSLITALAAEHKKDLVAFGASYKGVRGLDEGPAARRVAAFLGVELDLFEVTKTGWRSGFVEATLHFGAPLANASSVTIAQIAQRARAVNIKVLLTGEGADELFAGYSDPRQPPLAHFLSGHQRRLRRLEELSSGSPWRVILGALHKAQSLMSGSPKGGWDLYGATNKDEIEGAYQHHEASRRALETHLLREFDNTLSFLLNRMDKNMMQASVEARVPFLDPQVVELVLNLPLEARVLPWSKGILRDVARRVLPFSIAHRRKIYGMIFDAGGWIEEAANPDFLSRGMFRELFEIPDRDFTSLVETANGTQRTCLWSAEVWCRAVFGRETRESIEKELWPQGP